MLTTVKRHSSKKECAGSTESGQDIHTSMQGAVNNIEGIKALKLWERDRLSTHPNIMHACMTRTDGHQHKNTPPSRQIPRDGVTITVECEGHASP